jgi:hypothetical protein
MGTQKKFFNAKPPRRRDFLPKSAKSFLFSADVTLCLRFSQETLCGSATLR